MARPVGTKVYPCPGPKCKGRIVAKIGSTGTCKYCGTKVKFTKALFEKPAVPAKKPVKKPKK